MIWEKNTCRLGQFIIILSYMSIPGEHSKRIVYYIVVY